MITGAVSASGLPAGANLWLSRGALTQAGAECVDPGGAPAPPDDRYTLRHHAGDWYRFEVRFWPAGGRTLRRSCCLTA